MDRNFIASLLLLLHNSLGKKHRALYSKAIKNIFMGLVGSCGRRNKVRKLCGFAFIKMPCNFGMTVAWYGLHFVRDREGREVDFLITKDNQPWILIEAKTSRLAALSKNLCYFQEHLKTAYAFQVVFDMPYIEQDCFDQPKQGGRQRPLIVPAQTLFSQLV